jgi:hypothetical protein
MALLGQASGGWTESSSSLRILHVGIRNTVGVLTDDSFTQTNPPVFTASSLLSDQVDTATLGVLSGSVAIPRPDAGSNEIGGCSSSTLIAASGGGTATAASASSDPTSYRPLGVFINDAVGHAYENTPGVASGKGPYVSGQGTYANSLFESKWLAAVGGTISAGDDLTYITGVGLMASLNGYLIAMDGWDGAATQDLDVVTIGLESGVQNVAGSATVVGVLKMPADTTQDEIVYDQRI